MSLPQNADCRSAVHSIAALLALAASVVLGACGDDSISGPQGEPCGPPPYFTVLPVSESEIAAVPVFGGLGAPGHTLPTAHGGIFLTRENVSFRSPGDIAITHLRRVRYTGESVPPGEEDYAIFFQVCEQLTGWFGHVVTLAPRFSPETVEFRDCETYSTPFVTVESCEARGLDIKVSAGEALGTSGASAERGLLSLDIGIEDQRVTNVYVAPHRFGGASHAVCPWEQWDAANREILFSKLRDAARPHVAPVGEPRCGTMEVDVAGTAKGVWAEAGVTDPVGGDERRYITLADYPYRPQQELALSLGPETLGAHVGIVPRLTSGRVNRAFEHVTPDGQIYCYGPEVDYFTDGSWFLAMTSGTALRIERVGHAPGASPCNDDPQTWSFSAAAVSMVR